MARRKGFFAKNPSEARGIKKVLRALGMKFETKSVKKRNPKKRRSRKKSRARSRRKR